VDECQYFPARPPWSFLSPLLQYAILRGSHKNKREGNAEGKNSRPHIDRQFNRLYISLKHMEQAEEFAAAAVGGDFAENQMVQRALIIAAIVSYGRPFSGNQDHVKAVAHPAVSLQSLTEEGHKLHGKLCNIQNQAMAHCDFEMNPIRPVMYQGSGRLVASRIYHPLSEAANVRNIHALAKKVKTEFLSKLEVLARICPTE
jgi:acid stress-induced BolA-like protein IbaG/YrbA